MNLYELETPVPVVDLDIAHNNIKRLQDYCTQKGLQLRPHIKTHKLPFFAHEQIKAGAVGITVQKLGEAEIMAQTGLTDILITYNLIGKAKAERLANLTHFAEITTAIDNETALETLALASKHSRTPIGVLVEFESGGNRQGVRTPQAAVELAQKITRHPNILFKGLLTYPTTAQTGRFLQDALPLFDKASIPVPVISGGGTPTAFQARDFAPITELRVGTYIYNDRMMINAGVATLEDCAFKVLATVVSKPTEDRAIIDAGSKTLSSDLLAEGQEKGYGLLPNYPEAVIVRLNEEHGIIDISHCEQRPAIGEKITIIPNHVCVVTNLHDRIYLHRQNEIVAELPIYLRGKTI